jgi:hypothetical protein
VATVLELAKLVQKIIPNLILERRRVEFAISRWDKEGKREVEKSLIHLYFDLFDLNVQMPEITGDPVESLVWDHEDWFYPEQTSMTEAEVHKKLIEFYFSLKRMTSALDQLISAIHGITITNNFIQHLAGHISLTSTLLKLDIERLTGEELSG